MRKYLYIAIGVLLFVAGALWFFRSSESIKTFKPLNPETSKLLNSEKVTYANPDYGFSFQYPKEFRIAELPGENGGDAILIQEVRPPEGGRTSSHRGFQIAITPFDEEGSITPERIKQDIPDIVIEDPKEVLIGENKSIRALIFFSNDPSLGKTREVWFSHEGFLYQITAYAGEDALLGPILDSWRFR